MKSVIAILLTVIVIAGVGCSQDPAAPAKLPISPFRGLIERDNVLFNLQLAYSEMNADEVSRLLDENFVFNFSPSDVQDGVVSVAQWDRAAEMDATRNMFNGGQLPPGLDPPSDIALKLFFTDGADDWEAIPPFEPQRYPDETWYRQRVSYFLTVVLEYVVFTSGNAQPAEIVVRQVDDNGTMIWRIVSCSDYGGFFSSSLRGANAITWVESSSWGRVKALYAP